MAFPNEGNKDHEKTGHGGGPGLEWGLLAGCAILVSQAYQNICWGA